MALVELWRDDRTMSGPHPGVLLGSLEYSPQISIAQLVAQMSDDEVRELLAEVRRRDGQKHCMQMGVLCGPRECFNEMRGGVGE